MLRLINYFFHLLFSIFFDIWWHYILRHWWENVTWLSTKEILGEQSASWHGGSCQRGRARRKCPWWEAEEGVELEEGDAMGLQGKTPYMKRGGSASRNTSTLFRFGRIFLLGSWFRRTSEGVGSLDLSPWILESPNLNCRVCSQPPASYETCTGDIPPYLSFFSLHYCSSYLIPFLVAVEQ